VPAAGFGAHREREWRPDQPAPASWAGARRRIPAAIGPTRIDGLTSPKLRGAPRYADVAEDIGRRVDGPIVVAHNADFDHRFLSAEARRAGRPLPVEERLCTLALTACYAEPYSTKVVDVTDP
jgi:DNA polymerase III alpha subunit (gram-positive type)